MRPAVRAQVLQKRQAVRPTALAKQTFQRHQPCRRRHPDRRARDEQRRIPSDVLITQRAEGHAKVEVQRLKVARRLAIRR
jgi:hypothetical protein